jgi:hypothetical protein
MTRTNHEVNPTILSIFSVKTKVLNSVISCRYSFAIADLVTPANAVHFLAYTKHPANRSLNHAKAQKCAKKLMLFLLPCPKFS